MRYSFPQVKRLDYGVYHSRNVSNTQLTRQIYVVLDVVCIVDQQHTTLHTTLHVPTHISLRIEIPISNALRILSLSMPPSDQGPGPAHPNLLKFHRPRTKLFSLRDIQPLKKESRQCERRSTTSSFMPLIPFRKDAFEILPRTVLQIRRWCFRGHGAPPC
jgi:hypothetical protein